MGKAEDNKKQKKDTLFNTAYELFTTKGLNATAISEIVDKAGVAKGTFYLYFKDKYDIRNKLIAHKTGELFSLAWEALQNANLVGFEEQTIFIINYVIDSLNENRALLRLISKDLVMGALRSTFITGELSNTEIYENFQKLIEEDVYQYEEPDVMLFTIVELAGSAGYNSIQYEEPLKIEDYKPFLFRSIRLIIQSHQLTNK